MALPPIPDRSRKPNHSGGGAWYFSHAGKEKGPVSFRELREAAARGEFFAEDQLWREGGERRLASSVIGLFPRAKASTLPVSATTGKNDDIYAPPHTQTILDGPPGGLYLPHLRKSYFTLLPSLLITGAAMLVFGWNANQEVTRATFIALAGILWVIWGFLLLVYLRRAWGMMSMLGAHLSGNKAVLWMLVPLFNAVWSFVAVVGWARLWNRNVKNHPGLSTAWGVFVPAFVLFSLSLLGFQIWLLIFSVENLSFWDVSTRFGQVGLGLLTTLLIFGMWSWFHICHSINFLARKKS